MGRRLAAALGVASVALFAACSSSSGVRTLQASASDGSAPPPTPTVADPSDPTTTGSTTPADPTPTTPPVSTVPGRADELLNFGDQKPPRAYDEFLIAALNDVEVWWSEQYPQIYGEPFEPLVGGIYAGYPERADPIPGCGGDEETTYDELIYFAAFYCPEGDFMAYDDGESGLLYQLATSFGPSVMGVVLAHEYGHAIQQRAGVLAQEPRTIVTEQQADCFSGAWLGRAVRGEAPGVNVTDADIRAGLVALIQVRDPLGVSQAEPGSHGSGFDRVGAFQVGFNEGPARCAELVDNPLPLMPNVFVRPDSNPGGNAEFGYGERQIPGFAERDLNEFWTAVLSGGAEPFQPLELVPFSSAGDVTCDEEPVGDPEIGTLLCPSSRTVFLDEPLARQRHEQMGDFAIGYMLGTAWSEAAQASFDSPLTGEDRALINDCLTGAWTQTLVPDEQGNTARGVLIEPGDLDEAIQTALVAGDDGTADDVLGSPFEKIASFRTGVLGGVDACEELLQD